MQFDKKAKGPSWGPLFRTYTIVNGQQAKIHYSPLTNCSLLIFEK